ncbi:MAG: PAS domain-containing sensor histidine kinase, partial [Mesorhizobium sp.]
MSKKGQASPETVAKAAQLAGSRLQHDNMPEHELLALMFDQAPGFMTLLSEPGHVFQLTNAAYQ